MGPSFQRVSSTNSIRSHSTRTFPLHNPCPFYWIDAIPLFHLKNQSRLEGLRPPGTPGPKLESLQPWILRNNFRDENHSSPTSFPQGLPSGPSTRPTLVPSPYSYLFPGGPIFRPHSMTHPLSILSLRTVSIVKLTDTKNSFPLITTLFSVCRMTTLTQPTSLLSPCKQVLTY